IADMFKQIRTMDPGIQVAPNGMLFIAKADFLTGGSVFKIGVNFLPGNIPCVESGILILGHICTFPLQESIDRELNPSVKKYYHRQNIRSIVLKIVLLQPLGTSCESPGHKAGFPSTLYSTKFRKR